MKATYLTKLLLSDAIIAICHDKGLHPIVSYCDYAHNPLSLDYEESCIAVVSNDMEDAKPYHPDRLFDTVDDFVDEYAKDMLELEGKQDLIWLPVYKYEHSGVAYSTTPFGCKWDSGLVGAIYAHKTDIKEEYGWKRLNSKRIEKIESQFKHKIDLYSSYANGEVYDVSFIHLNDENKDSDIEPCLSDADQDLTLHMIYGFDAIDETVAEHLEYITT